MALSPICKSVKSSERCQNNFNLWNGGLRTFQGLFGCGHGTCGCTVAGSVEDKRRTGPAWLRDGKERRRIKENRTAVTVYKEIQSEQRLKVSPTGTIPTGDQVDRTRQQRITFT